MRRSREITPHFNPAALRELRAKRQLSLDALGALTGILRADLIGYEHGRRTPGIDRLAALATALEADPWQLTTVDPQTPTLADLRARAGVTKSAIATHLGIGRSTWDSIERGRRSLQADTAARVAEFVQAKARLLVPEHIEVHVTAADIQLAHQRGISDHL